MLIDGFVFLSQDQINMLALAAEPVTTDWMDPVANIYALPVLLAPEWPEKVEWGEWVIFSMDGTVYGFEPEAIKASLERALLESGGLSLSSAGRDYASVGLFQQRPFTNWISGIA